MLVRVASTRKVNALFYVPHAMADPGISKRGGGGPGALEVCFDAASHIPYVFVRRVVNNIHIVNTEC